MTRSEWKNTIALLTIITAALCWIAFGIITYLSGAGGAIKLVESSLAGIVLIATGLLAYRWRYVGGWALIFEGVLPVFLAVSRGNCSPIILFVIAGPQFISGALFLLDLKRTT